MECGTHTGGLRPRLMSDAPLGLGVAIHLDRASPMIRRCFAYGTGGGAGLHSFRYQHLSSYEFDDAVDADGPFRHFVDEHIGGMHIFQSQSLWLEEDKACSLAACSIATCCKASCSVACDDGRPNERRTCLAESRMLLLIKSRKVCGSIFNVVNVFIYGLQRRRLKAIDCYRVIYELNTFHNSMITSCLLYYCIVFTILLHADASPMV